MSALVDKLCDGMHPVEVSLRPEKTIELLKECLDRGYVHVRFTGTRGGTELGIPLDREKADLSQANLESGTGRIKIVGNLTLDYVKVRCVADIDLPALNGWGKLERVDDG